MSKEVAKIEQELAPITEQAKGITITDKTLPEAVQTLSRLNKFVDRVKEEKEKITRPLNEALRAERDRWRPVETLYTEAISLLRSKMNTYQTEQVRKQREEEAKIVARVGDGKGHIKAETAVRRLEAVKTPEKEVATTEGLVQFRTKQQLVITDESLIPREYLVVNERLVLESLKKGKKVPGAEIEEVQVAANYR